VNDTTDHSVLVVHRDQEARRRLADDLRAAGFRVVETDTGAKALELAEYFSALLVDADLPDVHGFEVCRILRAKPATAHLPCVEIRRGSPATGDGICVADGKVLRPVDGSLAPLFAGLLGAQR
jgi:CheY-like chemotaxis protein